MSTAITLPISNAPGLVGDSPWTALCPYFSDYDPSLACPEADPVVSTLVINTAFTLTVTTQNFYYHNYDHSDPSYDHSPINSGSPYIRNISLTGSITLTRKRGVIVSSSYGSPTAGPYFSLRRASIFNSRSGCSMATTPKTRISPLWWLQFGTNIFNMSGTDTGSAYLGSTSVIFTESSPTSILTLGDVSANPPRIYISFGGVSLYPSSVNSVLAYFNNWVNPGTGDFTGTSLIAATTPPVWINGGYNPPGSYIVSGSQTFSGSVVLT